MTGLQAKTGPVWWLGCSDEHPPLPAHQRRSLPIGPEYGCAIERPRPTAHPVGPMAVAVVYLAGLLIWELS